MRRQHYTTTPSRFREACENIALAVLLGIIAAMILDSWWFSV